ncbi:hypothetical protein [Bifidobacterium bombi]|uniref:Uncharacterized protein n=1 Tax=Bifidobacterium bombi DSM 19703 TaxID=1341695 RepID=A0A080N363_9BIFI|nr:hypothetical protein [Bifidobacterium bombi]KFF31366.1 hypothetical protein BBOMB_0714 [Bifidobacterium bombi DSM 19703]
MRLRDSAGEAFRNVTTGMTRPVTLIVMLSCVILACAGLDMRQVWGIEQQADAYRSSLSNAYFIKPKARWILAHAARCAAVPPCRGQGPCARSTRCALRWLRTRL